MKPLLKTFIAARASASLLQPPALSQDAEEDSFWDEIKPDYYVEEAESGIIACDRSGETRWFYTSPKRREGATIPDVFDLDGHIAFRFADGVERDDFLTSTNHIGLGPFTDRLEFYREHFGDFTEGSISGVALSGGGLGYTLGGVVHLEFKRNFDTSEIYLTEASFHDAGRKVTWIESVSADNGAPEQTGLWPDGMPTRVFNFCDREN